MGTNRGPLLVIRDIFCVYPLQKGREEDIVSFGKTRKGRVIFMAPVQRIGILTSGGDAPGMNPAIRAVVRAASAHNITCIGIRRGYQGLINGDVFELTGSDVAGISCKGGTILYTARSDEFRTEAGVKKAAKVCKYLGIDGIVAIGGDGTFRGALELAREGMRVVGIPATIDNDMGCTEYTIGFDTACNTAIEAIDKLRDTGQSHDRVSIVEVMGRNAGHLALYTGVAGGASAVLLPEKETDLENDVIDVIRRGCIHGRRHHIIVIAEGVGYVNSYAKEIESATGLETRVTVLGYIQRGGAPSGRDRVSASMMGVRAVEVLCREDPASRVIVARNGRFEDMDIEEALKMECKLDEEMYNACFTINTSYHDHRR